MLTMIPKILESMETDFGFLEGDPETWQANAVEARQGLRASREIVTSRSDSRGSAWPDALAGVVQACQARCPTFGL